MASRKQVRPTPPPSGPALVRPTVGAFVLALGVTAEAGCVKKQPETIPPMPNMTHETPMDEPETIPAADGEAVDPETPPPMPEDAPMPAPMPDPG
jgi:hypothetical protein